MGYGRRTLYLFRHRGLCRSSFLLERQMCIRDRHTNQQLIATLDEVQRIQAEGKEKRAQAEKELGRIEGELRAKLMENGK